MNVFKVWTKFEGDDKDLAGSFHRMTKLSKKFGDQNSRSFRDSRQAAIGFGSVLKGILAAGAVQRSLSLVATGVREVSTQFLDFDDIARQAATRFQDIGPDAKDFEQRLIGVKNAAREVARVTRFNPVQMIQGLDFLAKAGWKSEESFKALNSMVNLSLATGFDFARAADISSDLLGSFGLNADNTAQKIKNLNRLNDALTKTALSANVNLEDMFETMKFIGPIATEVLGYSVEDVAALVGVMGNSGLKGTVAMTALKNGMLGLSAPTSEARKVIRALGIEFNDAQNQPRKLEDVMDDLKKSIQRFSRTQRASIMETIFGKIGIAGAASLGANVDQVRRLKEEIYAAGGIAQRTGEQIDKSLKGKRLGLGSAAMDVGIQFLEAFNKDAGGSIESLTKWVRGVNFQPFVDGLKELKPIVSSIFNIFKNLIGILERTGVFTLLGAVFRGMAFALEIALKVLERLTGDLAGTSDAFSGVTKGVEVYDPLKLAFERGFNQTAITTSAKSIDPLKLAFERGWSQGTQGYSIPKAQPMLKAENLNNPNPAQMQLQSWKNYIDINQQILAPTGTKVETKTVSRGQQKSKMGYNLTTAAYGAQ